LDEHENSNKENLRNREPGCIYTIEYANSESSSLFFYNPSRETVVYCQSRLRYCYKATVRKSNKQGRSTHRKHEKGRRLVVASAPAKGHHRRFLPKGACQDYGECGLRRPCPSSGQHPKGRIREHRRLLAHEVCPLLWSAQQEGNVPWTSLPAPSIEALRGWSVRRWFGSIVV
jgi:hypothetical protein